MDAVPLMERGEGNILGALPRSLKITRFEFTRHDDLLSRFIKAHVIRTHG